MALIASFAGNAIAEEAEPPIAFEAPNIRAERDDSGDYAVIADQGFVARWHRWILMGDRIRWCEERDDLYATGDIVYVMPEVRIHADRLGMHPKAETGEAWNVVGQIERKSAVKTAKLPGKVKPEHEFEVEHRRYNISAEKLSFSRESLIFEHVRGSTYGGIISIGARRIKIKLREEPNKEREGVAREVSGIALYQPHVSVLGVPVLWIPYAYRDFIFDYPWTRFRFGHSSRLGNFLRSWIGTSLPTLFGVHTHVQGRYDTHTVAGQGYGFLFGWYHRWLGEGLFEYYGLHPETVRSSDDERLAVRTAEVYDAEHRVKIPGGAVYARYVSLPDADPLTPGGSSDGIPPNERFRSDYLREDLETRPFARRGVTGVWGMSLGDIAVDTERRPHPDLLTTDRIWGVQAVIPDLAIIEPVHATGTSWIEHLRRDVADVEATRMRNEAALEALKWIGGIGLDAGGGVRGLHYADGEIGGVDVEDEHRYVPFASGGIRFRWENTFANGLTHRTVPRIGVEVLGDGRGDVLTDYDFGDSREELEQDKRYGVTTLDDALSRDRTLFRSTITARWALREQDRDLTDRDGNVIATSSSDLVDVTGKMSGTPIATVGITANFVYDARISDWSKFDATVGWVVHPRIAIRNTTTLLPQDGTDTNVWQEQPGITLFGNRYDLDAHLGFKPGGDDLDSWGASIGRNMVDGRLTFDYELNRDATGHIYDQSVSVGFTMP